MKKCIPISLDDVRLGGGGVRLGGVCLFSGALCVREPKLFLLVLYFGTGSLETGWLACSFSVDLNLSSNSSVRGVSVEPSAREYVCRDFRLLSASKIEDVGLSPSGNMNQ